MKRIIKSLWVALATLSALLTVVSCVKELAVKEQEVNFESSLTTEQSQIVKGDSTVTTQLLINEEEVDCPRPTKYSVSFTYDEEAGTLFFLGDSIQSGKPISLSSLSDLALTYQAKKLVGNKVDVTVSNDAPKKLSKELVWNILADKTYWVKSEQEGDGEIAITGYDDLDAVEPDTKLAVTAKPADGWELVTLTANEEDILEDKSFVVTENTTVRATFKELAPKTYKVTLTKEGEGTVAISGTDNLDTVVTGSKLTVTATPSDGWEVKSITANGKDITADKSFVVTSNTVVKVVFKKQPPKTYAVTLVDVVGGTVAISGADNLGAVVTGSKLTVTATPADGWSIASMTANGVDILASSSFVVESDTNVKVVFKKRPPLPPEPNPFIRVDYSFVDEAGSLLPVQPSVSVESYPLYSAVIDVEKPIFLYPPINSRTVRYNSEFYGFDSAPYGPFWRVRVPERVRLTKPLSDYDLTGITVDEVYGYPEKRKPIPLTSSSTIHSVARTYPMLADTYDLTGFVDRARRSGSYLEVKCHFKRK